MVLNWRPGPRAVKRQQPVTLKRKTKGVLLNDRIRRLRRPPGSRNASLQPADLFLFAVLSPLLQHPVIYSVLRMHRKNVLVSIHQNVRGTCEVPRTFNTTLSRRLLIQGQSTPSSLLRSPCTGQFPIGQDESSRHLPQPISYRPRPSSSRPPAPADFPSIKAGFPAHAPIHTSWEPGVE